MRQGAKGRRFLSGECYHCSAAASLVSRPLSEWNTRGSVTTLESATSELRELPPKCGGKEARPSSKEHLTPVWLADAAADLNENRDWIGNVRASSSADRMLYASVDAAVLAGAWSFHLARFGEHGNC